ncbi:MAG: helix-turn-helix transcriptional regulator [Caulobacter sp.]|nr:helix-turn-helix transcriptional regulator [Caulobacter sp.]
MHLVREADSVVDDLNACRADDVAMTTHTGENAFCTPITQVPFAFHNSLTSSAVSTPAERLKRAREDARYETAKQAAEAMGVAVATYQQHESGVRGIPAKRARQYGRFFRVAPEWILYGTGQQDAQPLDLTPAGRRIPVLGTAQAGAWSELTIAAGRDEDEEYIFFQDPAYARASLYALEVRGNSMNRFYADGSKVIVVPAVESGVMEGDHVVVRRRRGGLVETTIKEVVVEKDKSLSLWARSTDPTFQTPLRIDRARGADESAEIVGVVVAKYEVGRQGRGPLLMIA